MALLVREGVQMAARRVVRQSGRQRRECGRREETGVTRERQASERVCRRVRRVWKRRRGRTGRRTPRSTGLRWALAVGLAGVGAGQLQVYATKTNPGKGGKKGSK